jgi:hypothetical protein
MKKPMVRLGSVLIVVSLALLIAPTAASALPDAVGSGSCKFTAGVGTFSPALTPTGSATVTKVTIKFSVNANKDCGSSLTSPTGGVIKGVTSIVGQGKYALAGGFANMCSNFVTADTVKIKVQTNWLASPAIAPSVTHYVLGAGTVAGGPGAVITFNGPPGSTVTGSFATPPNTGAKLVLSTSIPACPASVSSFKITGSYTSFSN